MRIVWTFIVAALAFVALPQTASAAATASHGKAFAAASLSDTELGAMRGSAGLLGPLQTKSVADMLEVQTRNDFAGTATVARLAYDNWINDIGAQLIVANYPLR